MKMNNEKTKLILNLNIKHKNQNKIAKGYKQEHQVCKQKCKQIFIMIKHENIHNNLPNFIGLYKFCLKYGFHKSLQKLH